MILVVNAENRRLFEADLVDMHRQRKIVFVDGKGWKIPVIGNMEVDEYDRRDTIYLLANDWARGPVLASVRLLTTTGPHLMRELFQNERTPEVPQGPAVWEVSRFCTAPAIDNRDRRLALLWETIGGVIEIALLYGIEHVIFAANHALLPLVLDGGWEAKPLGLTYRDGDDEVTAVVAETTSESLRGVRGRHYVPIPVTRLNALAPTQTRLEQIQHPLPVVGARARLTHHAWRNRWRDYPLYPGAPRHG